MAILLNTQYQYSSEDMDFYKAIDIKNNPPQKNMPIFAITIHYATTEIDSKKYIEFQKNRTLESGKMISKTINQDTITNGNKFYSMTINEIDNTTKQSQMMVYGFLLKNNNAIIFLGSDMGKHEYFYKLKML